MSVGDAERALIGGLSNDCESYVHGLIKILAPAFISLVCIRDLKDGGNTTFQNG